MKKPRASLALEILVVSFASLLFGAQCQSSQGGGGSAANLTVVGAVFCDTCSSSSFSKNSYFLPGVKVRLDCMIKVNSNSKEEIKITAEKVTNSYGAYQLDIPASTPASIAALATIAIAVSTAASSAAAATSTAIVSLAFPPIAFPPSRFFGTISSAGEVFAERSKHLVSFR